MPLRLSLALGVAITLTSGLAPRAGVADEINLQPVPNFLELPSGLTLGQCSGVATDSKGQVYVFHRGKQPILCFDAHGKFVRSWGDDVIGKAHGLRIDKDDNVWITDIGHHMVLKYDSQGKLLLSLGKADKPGEGLDQFNMPTDVAFGSQGELYISDGYGNSRVMKFTTDGKFVKMWGYRGTGPGEFNTPHAVRVDAAGRVYVGDRENKRIQVFDGDGKLLSIWSGPAPYGLAFAADGTLFVADGVAHKLFHLDAHGMVVQTWGAEGDKPGEYQLPHGLEIDRAGNVYVSEIKGMRVQKLKLSR